MTQIRYISEAGTAGIITHLLYKSFNGFPFSVSREVPRNPNKYRKQNLHTSYMNGPSLNKVLEITNMIVGVSFGDFGRIVHHLHWLDGEGNVFYAGTGDDHRIGALNPPPRSNFQLVHFNIAEVTANRRYSLSSLEFAVSEMVGRGAPRELFSIRDDSLIGATVSVNSRNAAGMQWNWALNDYLLNTDM